MASRDRCFYCGHRIGLSEETMKNDATGAYAHKRCVPEERQAPPKEAADLDRGR